MLRLFAKFAAKHPARCEAFAIEAGYLASTEVPSAVDSGDGWMCGTCGREFGTPGGLAAHRARKHGYVAPERQCIVGSVCPVCSIDFRTRRRARIHARYGAATCRAAFASGAVPLADAAAVAAADQQQAAAARAQKQSGIDAGTGLPAIPPGGSHV